MDMPQSVKDQIDALPKTPGVYFFKDRRGEILYIGKATSLRDRVRSYWSKELNRGLYIQKMVTLIHRIEVRPSDSAMEALIQEANYIKRYLPKYNIQFRDDKSYFYVKLDSADGSGFPRLSMVHKNEILQDEKQVRYYGPYTSGRNLRLALKTIRKIFPYRSCTALPKRACLQYHIKRCQAPCIGLIDQRQYSIAVNRVVMMLEGKKDRLVVQLKREMERAARKQDFEAAARLRNQYLALQHLHQMAKIADTDPEPTNERVEDIARQNIPRRIEGYDVSNLNGKEAVVAMVVFWYGKPAKQLYKRFKIRTVAGPNDYAMLQEAIGRRLKHAHVVQGGVEEMVDERTWEITDNETWQLPDMMIIDGGCGQISAVQQVLTDHQVEMPLIGIAKGPTRKAEDLYFSRRIEFTDAIIIRQVRDEAHRFALALHRQVRGKLALTSDLDDVPGVGPIRKKALLQHFGSVRATKEASREEIAALVGHAVAETIYRQWHNNASTTG